MESIFENLTDLPENFAEKLLELEMQLEKSCTIPIIQSLVDLYSSAMVYYESIKDLKYTAYHRRMQNLLLRSDVQLALTSAITPSPRQPLEPLNLNTQEIDTHIKYNTTHAQSSTIHALSNIKLQEDSIQAKLRMRKGSRNPQKLEADQCAGRENYENELVEFMESLLVEKFSKIQSIKNTYTEQMAEIREMGENSIISDILKQMDWRMNTELQEVNAELELKKAQGISRLKSKDRL